MVTKSLVPRLIQRFKKRLKKYGRTDKRTLELKALLRKAQNNWSPTPEFNKQIKKEWNALRIVKRRDDTYSITINYKDIIKSVKNDHIISDSVLEEKLVRDKPFTVTEAKSYIDKMEDDLNAKESGAYHTLTYISVDNLKLNKKQRLEESKMYKCNFGIYNKKISKWIDTGQYECVYEYLLHRYNGRNGLNLTKERIYDIIFQQPSWKERNFKTGLSCQDLERFCKWLGIPMYCVDITNSLFYKYLPEKRDKHYPVLCFICSNNHLYPIEDKKYIYSYRNIASDKIVTSNQVTDETKKTKERTKIIVDSANLNDFLDDLVYYQKQLPNNISRYNGQVQKVVCGDNIYSACEDKEKQEQLCKQLGLKFEGQNLTELGYKLFQKLYPKHKQTVCNNNVLKLFKDNNKGGFAYTWREPEEQERIITRDINKCYTSILRDNKYPYPVYNICDDVKVYDGEKLKCGYYWVETDNFFPLKGNGLYCYSTLIECQELGIDFTPKYQVLATHQLPADYFKSFVTEALKVEEYKTLINTTIGFLNKISTTFTQSRFTTDKNEAGYFFFNKFKPVKENDNRIHFVNKWNDELYEIETKTYNKKYENDIPIYQQVIEAGWIAIFRLRKALGGDLLCVKTDSVTVANATGDVELTKNIGGFKLEKNPEKYKNWKVPYGEFNIELKEWDEVDEEQYAEEYPKECIDGEKVYPWTDDIVNDIIESNEGCFIDGRAGTGKSELIRKLNKYCDENGLKYVNLAPTNKASRNINGQTIHKFFAIGRDNKTINAKKLTKLKGLDYVFIDEISMVSSTLLRFLHLAKLNNKNVKFILVGDSWQLPPVREEAHTDTYCVKFLADFNKKNFHINKRFDERLRKIADKWYLEGKINLGTFVDNDKVERYLTYTNRKRKEINDKMMRKHRKKKRFLELKYNPDYEEKPTDPEKLKNWQSVSQDLILNVGMPIISRKNCLKFDIVNNDEYKVVGFDKRKKMIMINNETKPNWTYNEFQEYFLPCYALTIHKSQGCTYDKPYKICEIEKIKRCNEGRSLLYVALTRARSKNLINISREKEKNSVRYSNSYIAKKVDSYKGQDRERNCENDLTVKNVQGLVDKNSNICHYCRRGLHRGNFTLDRVCSTLPHNVSNCVPCCYNCNIKKNDLVLDPDTIG
jgi:hypothetical protein